MKTVIIIASILTASVVVVSVCTKAIADSVSEFDLIFGGDEYYD